MSKLRLDLESITVETFVTTPRRESQGTVVAFESYGETHIDRMCSADCTGIGVECYTADPQFYDCTGGGAACTGGNACTYTTCTQDNVTCAYNCTAA